MLKAVFGEFMGTLMVVLMGNSVVANVLLKRAKGENSGWIVIATGWGFAVMCGVFIALAFGSEGQLNPAVTIASSIVSGDFHKAPAYIAAQLLGAFVGACLVWLHYLPHWDATADPDLKFACFATSPAIRSPFANFISEVIGTFVLVVVAAAMFSNGAASTGPAAGVGPWLVGSLVWGIGLGLGGTTGYAINPARDLGPRLAHAILPLKNKAGSDWAYAPIPIVGPIVGGVLAGVFVKLSHF